MKEKYIDLLLKKCINLDSKILFINYDIVNQAFVDDLVKRAKELGVEEVYLDKNDIFKEHEILETIELAVIEHHPYFDHSIWDEYARKNASFLMFRSPTPGVMDDIAPEKLALAEYTKRKTRSYYRKLQLLHKVPWCIAVLPNERWAKKVFGNREDSFESLEKVLYTVCMADKDNPIESWNEHLEKNKQMIDYLNGLGIKSLHYKNELGTDLSLGMMKDSIWCDASKNGLSNMPSYEIFTTPDYRKTNGIVYSARPLIYNGKVINNFWLRFENGKVVDFDAEEGYELLKSIITSDSNSCYLGECAILEKDSPIAKTGIIFWLTLLDENSSPHLALGQGFNECLKNSEGLTDSELLEAGINISKVHVDFMVGTDDLNIDAETQDGKLVRILDKGKFKL